MLKIQAVPGTPHQLRNFHAALADFYAPGLDAATYVDRAFELTSRLMSFALNSHGVIDRRTGALTANLTARRPASRMCSPPSAGSWAIVSREPAPVIVTLLFAEPDDELT